MRCFKVKNAFFKQMFKEELLARHPVTSITRWLWSIKCNCSPEWPTNFFNGTFGHHKFWRSARRLQFCVIRANWGGRVPYQEVGERLVWTQVARKCSRLQDNAASRKLYRAWLPKRTWWPMGDFITLLPGWLPSSCFQGQSEATRQGLGVVRKAQQCDSEK